MATKNSSRHLRTVLRQYSRLGVTLEVFVDRSTTDSTFDVAREFTPFVRHFDNGKDIVEGGLGAVFEAARNDWILRLDDDEVPSQAMLERVRALTRSGASDGQFGFHFRQAYLQDGRLSSAAIYDTAYPQFRLFNRRKVKLTTAIHTPGFELSNASVGRPDEFLLHLHWIVRSYSERLEKISRYDSHLVDAGTMFRSYYLVEENPEALKSVVPIASSEFVGLENDLRSLTQGIDQSAVSQA